ncbi:MAG: SMC family ATPase [Acholeplasmataceae bacterium]|nr:SMC family ATPase [Acholeplasmataceae bacterium]
MRINRIIMSAFGPFKGVETIDFTKANRNGIFLVSGPTGAGKTTIFDAISFALYGKASGMNRMDSEKTRSHFADPGVETYVELEFEVSGRHYKVKRSPKQDRPSKRGHAEVVTVQHQAEFTDLAIPDRILVKVSEVNAKIESILGLSHDQFRQIVMLPQGEFQALLNASSDARTEIFRRIFDTGFFETLQGRLKEASDVLRQSIRDTETELLTFSKQVITEERPDLEDILRRDEIAWHDLLKQLAKANHEDRSELRDAILQEQAMETESEALKERIRTIRAFNDKIIIKETLEATLTSSMTRTDEIEVKKNEVLAYDQAVRIRPDEINFEHAKQAHADQIAALGLLKETIEKLKTQQDRVEEDMASVPKLKETIKGLRRRELTLQSLIERVIDLEEKTRYIKTIKQQIHDLSEDADIKNKALLRLRDETKSVKDSLQTLEAVMTSRKMAYETMNEATRQLDAHQSYRDKVRAYHKDLKAYEASSSAFVTLSKSFSKTEASFRETQRLYANTHAARLANHLNVGEPCPVCG